MFRENDSHKFISTASSGDGSLLFIIINGIAAIIGLFFTSILIGIITTGIETKLQRLRNGNADILENNHTVILGWNDTTFAILAEIMEAVKSVSGGAVKVQFDPTLVRGMGYYTGTIFEVSMEGFGGSVAGGGRYDKMVGKFTGTDVPACGFSIGFERIIAILMDQQYVIPTQKEKVAILLDKKLGAARRTEALQEAEALRAEGKDVLVTKMAKNKKFQREQLSQQGYTVFRDYFEA